MQIGDPIIKQISSIVTRIEKQFNAFEMIDNFSLNDNDPGMLLNSVTKFLKSISDCKTAHLFFQHSHSIDHHFAYPNSTSVKPIQFEKSFFPNENRYVKLIKKIRSSECFLVCRIDSEAVPTCYIVLQDSYFGRSTNTILEPEFQKYVEILVGKIIEKFQNASRRTRLENFKKLTRTVMTGRQGETEELDPWIEMLSPVLDYLPNWGPYIFKDNFPRTQLLRILTGSQHLQVVSETDETIIGETPLPRKSELVLKREKTICGILLDNDDINEKNPYIYVDPTDYPDRYASVLFDKDTTPHSQLAFPIRVNNNIVAILNLEHKRKDAFSMYHIQQIVELISDLNPFVVHTISRENTKIDQEKELRYVIMKVASRVAKYETHNLNNDFTVFSSWLKYAKDAIAEGDLDQALKDIDLAIKKSRELSETKTSFFKSVKEFVNFKKTTLNSILEQTLKEFGKRGADLSSSELNLQKDKIHISAIEISNQVAVFSSGLSVEHLYNLLQNAREQIIIRREKDQDFSGIIKIGYHHFSDSEADKNIESLPMHCITISDNAGGVPDELQADIFKRGASYGKDNGTGFGLSASRDYFRKIGGDVTLVPATNDIGGATFNVIFPEFNRILHEGLANKLNLSGLTE